MPLDGIDACLNNYIKDYSHLTELIVAAGQPRLPAILHGEEGRFLCCDVWQEAGRAGMLETVGMVLLRQPDKMLKAAEVELLSHENVVPPGNYVHQRDTWQVTQIFNQGRLRQRRGHQQTDQAADNVIQSDPLSASVVSICDTIATKRTGPDCLRQKKRVIE